MMVVAVAMIVIVAVSMVMAVPVVVAVGRLPEFLVVMASAVLRPL